MTRVEHDKIVDLLKHEALQGIYTGRLDGKCDDVVLIEDAIKVIDRVYKEESEE